MMHSPARPFLVLERHTDGHRLNYAMTIGGILGCPVLIGLTAGHLLRAFATRHLVLSTFESSPKIYLALVMLRALTFRRSTAIVTRHHVSHGGRPLWSRIRKLSYKLVATLGRTQLLTITPPDHHAPGDAPMTFIEDLEFWDLGPEVLMQPVVTPLSERAVAVAAGRTIILATGTLEVSKGLAFLDEILASHPELRDRFAIVCAGLVMEPSRAPLANLARTADLWEDRYLTDEEIFSLYHIASGVWCCYHPSYDVSSGVFGRSIQFGRVSIVRSGSIIARLQAQLGQGVSLSYGDTAAAARQLLAHPFAQTAPVSRREAGRAVLDRLIRGHARRPAIQSMSTEL